MTIIPHATREQAIDAIQELFVAAECTIGDLPKEATFSEMLHLGYRLGQLRSAVDRFNSLDLYNQLSLHIVELPAEEQVT